MTMLRERRVGLSQGNIINTRSWGINKIHATMDRNKGCGLRCVTPVVVDSTTGVTS